MIAEKRVRLGGGGSRRDDDGNMTTYIYSSFCSYDVNVVAQSTCITELTCVRLKTKVNKQKACDDDAGGGVICNVTYSRVMAH